ncbi:patatin-like phospholipase family protein [Rhodoferax sp.]|uniref:patatin-like phospholipase family protein n=1 Tax=Rhodoferax sp. TaxID=50421 RepID=UPI001ECF1358|nr:patatin-like phospholipase family protein [Rhodoferax sp.]MBT9505590.1 patatin-like phospholipase family protein [Rhodoferax sp.]
MERSSANFDNVVFAGGGNRCFWQAGFWSVVAPALELRPRRVRAVSAGSAIACALFAGTFEHGFTGYKQALANNARNLYLRNLLREEPVFPHGGMYRSAILSSIDERALSRLHQGPEINVLISRPPGWASPRMALLLGALALGVDIWGRGTIHSSTGSRIGFKPLYRSVRECETPEALADLVIASSCVPPLTPQVRSDGMILLDGGLVSNVPAEDLAQEQGCSLILLTRQFPSIPDVPGRTYVQPSQPIPAGAWDYTDETAVQSTFDLGRRDGEHFCTTIRRAG